MGHLLSPPVNPSDPLMWADFQALCDLGGRVAGSASEAAAQDHPTNPGRFAIVAPSALAFGLGREYAAYRELNVHSKKQVGVFRTLAEALSFLGIETLDH